MNYLDSNIKSKCKSIYQSPKFMPIYIGFNQFDMHMHRTPFFTPYLCVHFWLNFNTFIKVYHMYLKKLKSNPYLTNKKCIVTIDLGVRKRVSLTLLIYGGDYYSWYSWGLIEHPGKVTRTISKRMNYRLWGSLTREKWDVQECLTPQIIRWYLM